MHMHPGLINSGATCYLNSLLQILYFTDPFKDKLFQAALRPNVHPVIKQLVQLFLEMSQGGQKAYSTRNLTKAFNWKSDQIYEQHDGHEFQQVLIQAICKGVKEEQGMNEVFGIKEQQFIRCLACSKESSTPVILRDISLPLYDYQTSAYIQSIQHSLLQLLKPQLLDINNLYHCSHCSDRVKALKGTRILQLPQILVLSLVRYTYDMLSGERKKMNSWIEFPQWLEMDKYIGEIKFQEKKQKQFFQNKGNIFLDKTQLLEQNQFDLFSFVQISQQIEERPPPTPPPQVLVDQSPPQGQLVYQLYALLIHVGSAYGGHYIALVKSYSGNWLQLDDQSVRQVDSKSFKKYFGSQNGKAVQCASTLYYRKKEWSKAQVPQRLREQMSEQISRRSEQQRVRSQSYVIMVYYKQRKTRLVVPKSKSLKELLSLSEAELGLKENGMRRIRLYDPKEDRGLHTFTGRQDQTLQALQIQKFACMRLEERSADQTFHQYASSSIQLKFYKFKKLQLLKIDSAQCTSLVLDSAQPLSAVLPILGPIRIYHLKEGKTELMHKEQLQRRVVFDLGLFSGAVMLFEPQGEQQWPAMIEKIKDNLQIQLQIQDKTIKIICNKNESLQKLFQKTLLAQAKRPEDYRLQVDRHPIDMYLPVASIVNKRVLISRKQQFIQITVWKGTRINCKYHSQLLFKQYAAASANLYQLLVQRGTQFPFRLRVYEDNRPFQQIPQDYSVAMVKSELMLQQLPYIDHRPQQIIVLYCQDPEFTSFHQIVTQPDSPLEELSYVLEEYSNILPKPLQIAALLDPQFTPVETIQFYKISSKKKVRDLHVRSGMIIFGRPLQPTSSKPKKGQRAEPVLRIAIEQ